MWASSGLVGIVIRHWPNPYIKVSRVADWQHTRITSQIFWLPGWHQISHTGTTASFHVDCYTVLAWWQKSCHVLTACCQPFVIGWSKYRLGLPQSQWIVGLGHRWEFPLFFRGQWQSPCTALMTAILFLLVLCKETVKQTTSIDNWQCRIIFGIATDEQSESINLHRVFQSTYTRLVSLM